MPRRHDVIKVIRKLIFRNHSLFVPADERQSGSRVLQNDQHLSCSTRKGANRKQEWLISGLEAAGVQLLCQ
jgi:hypothetical protein